MICTIKKTFARLIRRMKRITLFISLCLCVLVLSAQERKVQNRPYLDDRRLHYGFSFGLHVQDLEFLNNGYIDPETGEQWYADINNYNPGFNVGGLAELKLHKHVSLRVTTRKHQAFRLKTFDCCLEVGMGCDIYLRYFKLIPELKFCFGLANILKKDRTDLIDGTLMKYTHAVDKARAKMVVLTFYFE